MQGGASGQGENVEKIETPLVLPTTENESKQVPLEVSYQFQSQEPTASTHSDQFQSQEPATSAHSDQFQGKTPAASAIIDFPFQVYSRKNKQAVNQGIGSLSPKHSQSFEPKVSPETCNFQEKPSFSIETNCDLPIAVRKGVRSCTKHLIAHFLSYQKIDSE